MRIKPFWGYTFMFGLMIGIAVALLFAAELYVRTFIPQSVIPRYVTDGPHGVRINYPNIDIWHTTPEYRVNIRTNGQNMRSDREFTYAKPPGIKRIVALGDSFTFGIGVDVEDHYLTISEEYFKNNNLPIEIINLGVPGFSNAEELIVLQNEAFRYDPDLIILAFYQNDLSENIISDLFTVSDGELVRKNEEYLPAIKLRNALYSVPLYRYLAERSNLLYMVRRVASDFVYKARLNNNAQESTVSLQDEKEAAAERADYRRQLTASIIDRIYEVTQEHRVPLVLVDIPWDTLISEFPKEDMRYFDQLNYFEPAKVLEKDLDDKYLYWKKSFWHWTPYAHQQVGLQLAQYIIENDLIKEAGAEALSLKSNGGL